MLTQWRQSVNPTVDTIYISILYLFYMLILYVFEDAYTVETVSPFLDTICIAYCIYM